MADLTQNPTNANTSTPPFSLTDPSTYSGLIPSMWGGLQEMYADVSGAVQGSVRVVEDAGATVYTAAVDPLFKDVETVETGAVSAIKNSVNYVTTKAGNAVGGLFSAIISPLQWALFAIVVIGALYLFGPLLLASARR